MMETEIKAGLELANNNESYDLAYSEMRAIRDNNHDMMNIITDAYYLGLKRGYNAKIKECIKPEQKEEIMQLFNSLDERRRRLVLVHIRSLAGKNARTGL